MRLDGPSLELGQSSDAENKAPPQPPSGPAQMSDVKALSPMSWIERMTKSLASAHHHISYGMFAAIEWHAAAASPSCRARPWRLHSWLQLMARQTCAFRSDCYGKHHGIRHNHLQWNIKLSSSRKPVPGEVHRWHPHMFDPWPAFHTAEHRV